MKLTLSLFIALFLSAATACAQQATSAPTSSAAATGATQSRSVGGQGSAGFVSSVRQFHNTDHRNSHESAQSW